ncbi:MAG: matrixin family metalloprotease [Thaumarchaeota archaeon]|nr:matrixin family metalloprotease [Nitrososphaerota archaeon]MDE0265780.1 matrixin family metalloprotease [Nitrososphaerota archaeon]MDE0526516.1 matrixin family metalloprotease [Nitrososphaerota archaeon]
MTMHNFKIALVLLSVVTFATSYTLTEVYATDPDWGGHKWLLERTDYKYGSMSGFTGLTQAEIYAGLDFARAEISQASDYDIHRTYSGPNWITKANWSDLDLYGQQYPEYFLGYITGSDIELNNNQAITWYDGTSGSDIPNIKAVAVHEMFHGADMDHVYQSGSAMFHSYSYYDWVSLSDDDEVTLAEIYGTE